MRAAIFALLLSFASSSMAGDIVNGTYSDGYVFQNGYWYLGQQAYTRASVPYTYQAWDGYGRCYRTYTAYKYVYTPYVAPVSYKDPDWKAKLLAIAEQRDRFILNQRKDAIEQNNFIETVRELGLSGNFAVQGYGVPISYANPLRLTGSYGVSSYGNTGSTVYGYSYSTIADLYGKADLSVLQNQFARSVENSQNLAGQAVTGLESLLQTDGASRERIAALLAKGQIMSRLAETLETPGARTETKVDKTVVTPAASSGTAESGVLAISQLATKFQQAASNVIRSRCVTCHSGDKPKGGLDLTSPFTLSAEVQKSIVDRVRHSDPQKRMPVLETGEPGDPLTNAELRALMNAFEN